MGKVGDEPTKALASRVTVCPDSPTSALTQEAAQTRAGGVEGGPAFFTGG